MYSEKRTSFSIRDVILQLLFVVLFVFILVWLFPTKDDMNKVAQPFYDRIFGENILIIKDAAKSYFTNERLPQNAGDKVTITLGEMIDKKLVIPFKDGNGNSCDMTGSYVEVTKAENEYVMKINLKCTDNTDYIIVNMGCYDYCLTTICEKEEEKEEQEKPKPVINRPPSINLECNINCTAKPKPPVYKCQIINGVYYGVAGNKVTAEQYKKECEKPETETKCKYVKENARVCKEWNNWVENIPYDNKEFTWNEDLHEEHQRNEQVQTDWKFVGWDKSKSIWQNKDNQVIGTYRRKVCEGYTFYEVRGVVVGYQIGNERTLVSQGWYSSIPDPQGYYSYEVENYNPSRCIPDCGTGKPYLINVYKNNITPIKQDGTDSISVSCTKWNDQTINIYGTQRELIGYEPIWEAVYKDQKYYRYQTCKTMEEGGTSTIWSKDNDQNLLNQGYKKVECITVNK